MNDRVWARDVRGGESYQQAHRLYRCLRQPGTGQISDATEVHVRPDGRYALFTGTILDALEGSAATRVCQVDLETGETRVLTFGPATDRLAKYSPNGGQVAFLSDRTRKGDFQLYLLDPTSGAARPTPRVEGWVEYFHWSPDGSRIVLGVAGHGADVSGGQGAVTSGQLAEPLPSWMPTVETGDESYRWRRAWVYDVAADRVRPVGAANLNVWEVTWCGRDALAAVASPGPGEGLWYSARLHVLPIDGESTREVYAPQTQLGWPEASPSGQHLAIVEAVCSDRWIVAGDLRVIDLNSGNTVRADTHGIDVTYTEWRSDRHLLLAGHRGFETVVGVYDALSQSFSESWSSQEVTTGGRYVSVSGFGTPGDCVIVGESYTRAPEIGYIRQGQYRTARSFDLGYADLMARTAGVERVSWKAGDGLEIQGWLLRPLTAGPHGLVMNVHGGPVWHWRPTWLGRSGVHLLMLLQKGYAVFFPNPRGSAGRGQDFAGRVLGDMGGADTHDYLSGLDHLVQRGWADPARLGVTGGSYGGFMTSWLITQDPRFAAAVPVAPVTNHVSEHLISNIPHFTATFLADRYTNAGGKYFQRSPIMHAHKVKTPTLNMCGALDRCTPPEEAVQFHNALLENHVTSVLVTYPEEGHGIRKFPALLDYSARVMDWFGHYLR